MENNMTSENIRIKAVNLYNELSAAKYACVPYVKTIGKRYYGNMFLAIVPFDKLALFATYCDNATAVRIMPKNKAVNDWVKENALELIETAFTLEEFEKNFENAKLNGYKGNRGNYFETLADAMLEEFDGFYKPVNDKFDIAGDCFINKYGNIQVKFYNATLCKFVSLYHATKNSNRPWTIRTNMNYDGYTF